MEVPRIPGLVWHADPGSLELVRPVVVVALEGWFDLGHSATGALHHLIGRRRSTPLGYLDAEDFVDMTSHRPDIAYRDGRPATLTWPHTEISVLRTGGRHDLVCAVGIEPDYRFGTFADGIISLARVVGAELVVTLGGGAADVPHTRPQPLVVSASTAPLARRLGLSLPSYQGLTGVVGVLQERLARAGVPAISVRVSVPAYLGADVNPAGTQALLVRLGELLGIDTGSGELDEEVRQWLEIVNDAVAEQPGGPAFVSSLERRFDSMARSASADRLVEDLERYLREGDDPA